MVFLWFFPWFSHSSPTQVPNHHFQKLNPQTFYGFSLVFPYGFSYGFPLGSLAAEGFGMVFAASNIARLLLPLRFGAALAMAPWVDENIMRRGSPGEPYPGEPCPGQGMGWPQKGGFTQENDEL
jgi:hypothetical protein